MVPLLATLALAAASPDSTLLAAALRAGLAAPRLADSRWGDIADIRTGLTATYEGRGWQPLWVAQGRASASARAVVREFQAARFRGLDPDDYDADRLAAQLDSLDGTPTRTARLDLALSAAATRYALALDRGRVDPRSLHPTLRLVREPFDVARTLGELARAAAPAGIFRALEPPFYQYRRLQSVLETYRLLARDTALALLPEMPRKLTPGMTYQGAPQLRRLLTLLGDLQDVAAVRRPAEGDTLYDDALATAIRRFQRRQGFGSDGVIGDSTRLRLTRTFASHVRQIELTLERWRWLPRRFETPPIVVNIPGFRLYALKGTQDVEAEMLIMDVVVGTAVKHDTPLLAVDLTAIQFQPPWHVPTSIMRDEIRPKAMKDSSWLAREGYELLRGGTVVPVTDSTIRAIGSSVRVRQKPGPLNSLGRVKFVMPNPEDIYLHDTPARTLFGRVRRDFSHGCIRVADPAALAAFLLRDKPEWTPERIAEALRGDTTRWVPLPARVPVLLVYQSVVVKESGETFFYRDLYGHDRTLDRALRRGYPYLRPESRPAT